jgi:hypothetical protein
MPKSWQVSVAGQVDYYYLLYEIHEMIGKPLANL